MPYMVPVVRPSGILGVPHEEGKAIGGVLELIYPLLDLVLLTYRPVQTARWHEVIYA